MTVPVDPRASKPVCDGEYVVTASGLYGLVDGFDTVGGTRIAHVLEWADDDDVDAPDVWHRVSVD